MSAAAAVLAEVGPAQFTLAKAAARAGVAPATYVKRFDTKQGVFLALNRRWASSVAAGIDAQTAVTSGVDRIRAAAMWSVADMDDHERAANMLATLALDLQYPQMTALLDEGWTIWRDRVRAHIEEVIGAGQLSRAPAASTAADMLFALVQGTLISWCVRPRGSLEQRVRENVDELLSAWS